MKSDESYGSSPQKKAPRHNISHSISGSLSPLHGPRLRAWFARKKSKFLYVSLMPAPRSPTSDPIPFSLQLIFGYILLYTPKFFPSWGLSPLSVPWSRPSSPNSAKAPLPPGRLPAFKTQIKGLLTPLSRANPFFCSFPETRFLLLIPSLCLQGAHTPG